MCLQAFQRKVTHLPPVVVPEVIPHSRHQEAPRTRRGEVHRYSSTQSINHLDSTFKLQRRLPRLQARMKLVSAFTFELVSAFTVQAIRVGLLTDMLAGFPTKSDPPPPSLSRLVHRSRRTSPCASSQGTTALNPHAEAPGAKTDGNPPNFGGPSTELLRLWWNYHQRTGGTPPN